jgi:hypothetical protein
MLSKKT